MFEDFRLRIFMEVAAEGSFTKAAKKLGVSQPAVSQNISELEKQLGTTLFERMRGEVALTDAGKTFQEYASNILHWYHAAGDMFGDKVKGNGDRSLVVCADPFISDFLLPEVVSSVRSSEDRCRFDIRTQKRGEEDIQLSLKMRSQSLDFDGVHSLIGIVQASLAASDSTIQQLGKSRTSLDRAPLAVWSKYVPLLPLDMRSRIALETDSLQSVVTVAENSNSVIAVIPYPVLKSSNLQVVPYPLPKLQLDIHMEVLNTDIEKSLLYQKFNRALIDSLK